MSFVLNVHVPVQCSFPVSSLGPASKVYSCLFCLRVYSMYHSLNSVYQVSVCPPFHLSLSICLSTIRPSTNLIISFVCPFIHLPDQLIYCLSVCPSSYLSILPVCLPVHPCSISLYYLTSSQSVHPSVLLSVKVMMYNEPW